ncbi:MAG: lysoplasmalogenase family protein [Christensenellales bacterium]
MPSYFIVVIMMLFLVGCFLVTRILDKGVGAVFTKTVASLGMILGALLVLKESYSFYYIYIIIGLVCGLIGDIFLELKRIYSADSTSYFNVGMLAFALGHIMYFMAIYNLNKSVNWLAPTLISAGIAIAFSCLLFFVLAKPMKLDFANLKWQSFAYCVLLTFLASLACSFAIVTHKNLLIAIGLVAFLLSDLVLSMQYFKVTSDGVSLINNNMLTIINHILYYGAQVLILGQMYYLNI